MARAVVLLLFLAAVAPRAHAAPEACARGLVRATLRLEQKVLAALARCAAAKASGRLDAALACAEEARTRRAVEAATAKQARAVAKACGGRDRRCGSPDDEPLASLGWDLDACPAFPATPTCAAPIAHCGDVAACIACVAAAAGARTVAPAFPSPTAGADTRCLRALAKSTSRLLRARARLLAGCRADRDAGRHADPCPNGATLAQLDAARARRSTAVCRACGGADRTCDGTGDVDPATLGFPADCPAGAACPASVASMTDLLACVDCATDATGDCAGTLAARETATYPDGCRTCCGPRRIVITTDAGASVGLGTIPDILAEIDGIPITLDVGLPDEQCRHPVTIPPDGFPPAVLCVPFTGHTVRVDATGCAGGDGLAVGRLWDGRAAAPDPDVDKAADSSDGVCSPPGLACNKDAGGVGADALGAITTTIGDGMPNVPGLHVALEMPGTIRAWKPPLANGCPDADGMLDAGVDDGLAEEASSLALTTARGRARFVDRNADA
jgi:hypothetical protein